MPTDMSPSEIERDLAFAVAAARAAGERVLHLRDLERWEGKMLADIGDQAADGYLNGLVEGRYPEDGLLSEETVDSPARLGRERAWIIDPLDGTKEFSQLREDWAVHVALTVGGRPALAAVALPRCDRILWGVALPGHERGGLERFAPAAAGEDREHAAGDALEPLTVGVSVPAGVPRVAVSRSHTPEWVERFNESLGGGELVRAGSAGYKVSRLLLGEADVYVHKIGLKEWDTCAPETVARALGWTVCKLRGEDHVYNAPDPRNHELVVCRPALRERVLAALADSGALAD
jgi:3'(2'), 5'-bisphosphate nucleotidase